MIALLSCPLHTPLQRDALSHAYLGSMDPLIEESALTQRSPASPRGCSCLCLDSELHCWKSPKTTRLDDVAVLSHEWGNPLLFQQQQLHVSQGIHAWTSQSCQEIHASIVYGGGHVAIILLGDIAIHGGTSKIYMDATMFWRMIFSSYFI